MTHLFNGSLKQKIKGPVPNSNSSIKALARNYANDPKTYEEELDQSKIPLPTLLLSHEIDTDIQMVDTLLNICDQDGNPFKWKYLCDNMEDVMELLKCDDFFESMPMANDFNYFVARDCCGVPVNKYEIDSIARQRKIFEKRALKKRSQYEKRKQQLQRDKSKTIHKQEVKTTITF